MKKVIPVLLFILCGIALAECSGNSSPETPPSEPPESIEEPAPAPAGSETPAPAPAGSETPAPAPAGSETPAPTPPEPKAPEQPRENKSISSVTIQVGGKNFTVTLYDNASTQAFLKKLPLTLDMEELNGNEKFYFFSESLPSNGEQVGSIRAGDLMLYGSDCLVLFYENFSTSHSYTRLGYIEDTAGLADAPGSESAEVTFSAQ